MSTDGVTQGIRAALAAQITTGGTTCHPYDDPENGGSYATLGAATWELTDRPDQRYGVGAVTFRVFVYQLVDASVRSSLAYHEVAFQNVLDGLGADRTLGGAVPWSEVSGEARQGFYRDTPGGALTSIIEFPVTVVPFANAA